MFIYVPLEQYKERYTEFLSGPTGVVATALKEKGIQHIALRPNPVLNRITKGFVLDPVARCSWAFRQTESLVSMLLDGGISSDDVIYIEDFWHPGMEMIPYAMDIANVHPKLYAFCHAQSVDPNDFTYAMLSWIRDFETAWGKCLTGIFTASDVLTDWIALGSIAPLSKIHTIGTVFSSQKLKRFHRPGTHRKTKRVVFSSRWDKEKQPGFFMDLVERVKQERSDIEFVVCTGFKELVSNDPALVARAKSLAKTTPQFKIYEDCDRSFYYGMLDASKVQFNCALQDFVSYTLLEATTFGCAPLYPNYLSFPEPLNNDPRHLYSPWDQLEVKEKLYALLDSPEGEYSWVYLPFEQSFDKALKIMGVL
jgi:glycosyltransferase involved in cell wall biosynthesis